MKIWDHFMRISKPMIEKVCKIIKKCAKTVTSSVVQIRMNSRNEAFNFI